MGRSKTASATLAAFRLVTSPIEQNLMKEALTEDLFFLCKLAPHGAGRDILRLEDACLLRWLSTEFSTSKRDEIESVGEFRAGRLTTKSASKPTLIEPFLPSKFAILAGCSLHTFARNSGPRPRAFMPVQVAGRLYCKPV